jgi:hypothetical protein
MFWVEESWLDTRQGKEIFLFFMASTLAIAPSQPPVQWLPGTSSLRINWPGLEPDHLQLHQK